MRPRTAVTALALVITTRPGLAQHEEQGPCSAACEVVDETCWDVESECYADNVQYSWTVGPAVETGPPGLVTCDACDLGIGRGGGTVSETVRTGLSFCITLTGGAKFGIPGCVEGSVEREGEFCVDRRHTRTVSFDCTCPAGTRVECLIIREERPIHITATLDYFMHADYTWDGSCPDPPANTTFCSTVYCNPDTLTFEDTEEVVTLDYDCVPCAADDPTARRFGGPRPVETDVDTVPSVPCDFQP
ncbi:MAG: hypothetical protein ACYTG1_06925 [Planctomycetota bacterium]|jgi:hypothetical protein